MQLPERHDRFHLHLSQLIIQYCPVIRRYTTYAAEKRPWRLLNLQMMHCGNFLILQNLFVPTRIARFNSDKLYIFLIKCIYVFHMIITINIEYYSTQY